MLICFKAHFPDYPIKTLRMDNAQEFRSKSFEDYCTTTRIELTYSVPYEHAQNGLVESFIKRCRVERSLLWEITGSLAAIDNDLRVGNQLLFFKPKIVIKQTVFNYAHTKDPRPTSSIQR